MSEVLRDHGLTESAAGEPGQEVIDQAVATVRRLCGWHVWPVRQDTLVVDTPGDPVVFLPTKRIVDVHAVRVDGEPVDEGGWSWSEDGMIEIVRPPKRAFRRVEVDLQHGYDDGGPLAGVAMEMAGRAGKPAGNYSVGRISVGGPSALTPASTEWRIVDEYRLGPMP